MKNAEHLIQHVVQVPRIAFALLATVWIAFHAAPASAAMCDSFTADSGNNTIILGETTSYFWYAGQYWYYGTGALAVCWEDSSSIWNYEERTGCDTSSSSGDYVWVQALAGDDIVAPNTTLHICETPYIDTYMEPFDEATFDFYLYAYMGTGADRAVGTGKGDKLYSNTYGTLLDYLPADSAEDVLCGCNGNDSLYGDHDDTNTYEEILHGGGGTNYCNGGADGNTYDWAHSSTCDTIVSAYSSGTDWGSCAAEPISHWGW